MITMPLWLLCIFCMLPTAMGLLCAHLWRKDRLSAISWCFILPCFLLAPLFFKLYGEEAPRTLDPKKPEDAVQIVAQICAQVPLKMADSQAVLTALQTLAESVKPKPVEVKPVEPEKAKP